MTKRRCLKSEISLEDRILEWAWGVHDDAAAMAPGPDRDELLKKVRNAETAMHLNDWANSLELQSPK